MYISYFTLEQPFFRYSKLKHSKLFRIDETAARSSRSHKMDQIRATKRILVKNYNKAGDQRNLNHYEFLVRGDPVFSVIKKIITFETNNGTDQLMAIKNTA